MTATRKSLKTDRREQRLAAQRAREAVERREQRQRLMVLIAGGLALIALLAAFVYFASAGAGPTANVDPSRRGADTTSRGYPSLGNRHISPAEVGSITYNSEPPSSGPHLSNVGPGGWHDESLPRELVVHNLEDGYMAIHYRPDLAQPQMEALRAFVERFHGEERRRVVAVPNPKLSTPLALAAWTRVDELRTFDEARIRSFADAYAYEGADYHKR